MAEKFKPTREAQQIALRSMEAQPAPPSVIPGAKEEWRYELTDGRVWYVKANHIAKVKKLGIGPGVPFRAVLREYAAGKTVLDVLPVAQPSSSSQAAPPAPATTSPLHPTPSARLVTPIRGDAAKAMGQLGSTLADAVLPRQHTEDPTNGNGKNGHNGHAAAASAPAALAIPVNGHGD